MSTSLLKALPGKLYIKRNSPSILYIQHDNQLVVVLGLNIAFNNFSVELQWSVFILQTVPGLLYCRVPQILGGTLWVKTLLEPLDMSFCLLTSQL